MTAGSGKSHRIKSVYSRRFNGIARPKPVYATNGTK